MTQGSDVAWQTIGGCVSLMISLWGRDLDTLRCARVRRSLFVLPMSLSQHRSSNYRHVCGLCGDIVAPLVVR
jgi:hypothetical protein